MKAPAPEILAFDKSPSVRSYDQKSGHLSVAMANISKANICPYMGREIPDAEALGLEPDAIYQLLRDPREMERAAASFSGKPLLLQHRPQTAADHDYEITIGAVGECRYRHPYLMAPLSIWAGAGIEAIETGAQQELSSGYFYRADMTPGEYEGVAYDGRMVDIVGNHVAIVDKGRAGSDVFVGDKQPMEMRNMPTPSRKAVQVKGALTALLLPKMAADAKLPNLDTMLKGLTQANFQSRRQKLLSGLSKATEGKMAQDADLDDVVTLLDKLDDVTDEVAAVVDEPEAPKPAAAVDEDPMDQIKAFLADKLSPEDMAALEAIMSPDAAADADKPADKPAPAAKEDKPVPVTKAAMDAAIAATANATVKRMQAVREAERAVAPIVGEIMVAMDSAAEVYKLALDHLEIDVTGVHPSAYPAVLAAHTKAASAAPRVAMDAAGPAQGYRDRFPTTVPLKRQ